MTGDVLKGIPAICMFMLPTLARAQDAASTAMVVDATGSVLLGITTTPVR